MPCRRPFPWPGRDTVPWIMATSHFPVFHSQTQANAGMSLKHYLGDENLADYSLDADNMDWVGVPSSRVQLPPPWRSTNPIPSGSPHVRCTPMGVHRTCAWGCIVRVVGQARSRNIPTRNMLPLFFGGAFGGAGPVRPGGQGQRGRVRDDRRLPAQARAAAPAALQEVRRREPFNLTPDGVQFDSVRLPARTPLGGASYVW